MSIFRGRTPRVSVLVPIYNTERYLGQCLDALCNQSLKDIEIICINDGSIDSSLCIIRKFEQRDRRIRVIDKMNSGYGASMNQGIEAARGEYVGIAEPDDFSDHTMYATLYRAAKKSDSDLAKSNYYEHEGGEDRFIENLGAFPNNQAFELSDYPNIICTIPSIWTGLYSREMLERNHIRFRETPGASFQDTSFVLKTWFSAARCILIDKPLVHYRVDNPDSSVKADDKVFTVCDELEEAEEFLRARTQTAKQFLPWFHVDKLEKYRWNYERVAACHHHAFALRMQEEYRIAEESGELHRDIFSPKNWETIQELLCGDAESFAEKHPERF